MFWAWTSIPRRCFRPTMKATDVNAATDKGETPLHGAAKRGNKRGFTALDLAMGKGGYHGALGPVHDTRFSFGRLLKTRKSAYLTRARLSIATACLHVFTAPRL
jgi:hypothetical protein